MSADDEQPEPISVTLHRTEQLAPGVIRGFSDDYPDRQFLIFEEPNQ